MKRSDFLRLSCAGCVLGGAGILSLTELLSCAPGVGMSLYKAPVADHQISVPESEVKAGAVTIVRGKGMDYDIALRRGEAAGDYEALLLRCTHFSNPLQTAGDGFTCNLHGSRFDKHGIVLNGPASKPLMRLTWIISGGNILIHV